MKKIKTDVTDPGLFQLFLNKKGLRESTIDIYTDSIILFLARSPDLENIDDYNTFLKRYAYDKKSYHVYYALRMYVKWKVDDISLRTQILNNLLKPKNEDPSTPRVYLTYDKREQVITNLEREKHIVMGYIQLQTGARVGDVLVLRTGSITYENYKGALAMKLEFVGKRGRRSPKYIFEKKVQDLIITYINKTDNEGYYFLEYSKRRNKLNDYSVVRANYVDYWRDLKMALEKCSISKDSWSTHDFRRNISRDIWDDEEIGKDVQLLQNYLAHANPATTLRYLKHSGLGNRDVSLKMLKNANRI